MSGDVLTVVIPARNAAATLAAQLQALDRQVGVGEFRVIVVDNGSTDATGDVARSFASPRFTLDVVYEERPGINVARNAGIVHATAGKVFLCDADDEVTPGWLAAMSAAVGPGHWAAGVVDYTTLNDARTRLQWGAPPRSSWSIPDRSDEPFVDRTFGCNCGFTREMWERVGRFDERLSGIGGDETEMFQRAHAHGYRPTLAPDAVVAYRLRPGVRNMCRQRFRQGRNQIRMSRFAGGLAGRQPASTGESVSAIGRLLLVSPKYALTAASRYEWLGAISRHLGRVAGRRERRDGQ